MKRVLGFLGELVLVITGIAALNLVVWTIDFMLFDLIERFGPLNTIVMTIAFFIVAVDVMMWPAEFAEGVRGFGRAIATLADRALNLSLDSFEHWGEWVTNLIVLETMIMIGIVSVGWSAWLLVVPLLVWPISPVLFFGAVFVVAEAYALFLTVRSCG